MANRAKNAKLDPNIVIADGEQLDLRNRFMAAVLAWMIPGAGHAYQRRYLKSTIFSISVFTCFLAGMLMSQNKCVYASWDGTEKRWQYFLQAGVGLPAMPAVYQAWKGRENAEGFMAAPRSLSTLSEWHKQTASGFEMGTLYTMIAGILNMLVVFDAYGGPMPPPVNPKSSDPKLKDPKPGGDGPSGGLPPGGKPSDGNSSNAGDK